MPNSNNKTITTTTAAAKQQHRYIFKIHNLQKLKLCMTLQIRRKILAAVMLLLLPFLDISI
jgi:hypothetical protein